MDGNQERIQRALNDQKRQLLEERHDVRIYQGDIRLPPEVEGDWLEYIAEFERQFSAHRETTVGAFAGHPAVRPLASIPPEDLSAELELLLEHLLAHNIVVHFGRPVSDAEAYRFITEELLNEKMEDIRIDGMLHTFLYDECHPDEAGEVRSAMEDFLMAFFMRDRASLWRMCSHLAPSSAIGGNLAAQALMQCFETVFSRIMTFTGHCFGMTTCEVHGDHAHAHCVISWTGIQGGTRTLHGGSGEARIRFRRNEYGAWDVERVSLPGLTGRGV